MELNTQGRVPEQKYKIVRKPGYRYSLELISPNDDKDRKEVSARDCENQRRPMSLCGHMCICDLKDK